jgi:hypothetical protein
MKCQNSPSLYRYCRVAIDDVRGLDGLAGSEGLFQHATSFQVAQFDPVERLTFARLDEFVFNDGAGVAVQQKLEAAPKLVGVVRRHRILVSREQQSGQ